MKTNIFIVTCFAILPFIQMTAAHAERIKDLAAVEGMRENQLIGYGLVVGLVGSGDKVGQVSYTRQSLKNMLAQLGIVIPPGVNPKPTNVAAVMLTATLPPFIKKGQKIDVTASSVGNAKSLRGGTLLMSPLKGADGKVYAVAQGNLAVGGLGVEGADGSKVTINIPSVGRIPNGAIVERTVTNRLGDGDKFVLNLFSADFTTASRMAKAINEEFGVGTARPVDPISIEVKSPATEAHKVAFLSMVENLTLEPGEAAAQLGMSIKLQARQITSILAVMILLTATINADRNRNCRLKAQFRQAQAIGRDEQFLDVSCRRFPPIRTPQPSCIPDRLPRSIERLIRHQKRPNFLRIRHSKSIGVNI